MEYFLKFMSGLDFMLNLIQSEAEEIVSLLKDKNLKISFAESCTGGLLSANLTSVSGCSSILSESYVTYSEASKMKLLKVKKQTLADFSVVSSQVAEEMALGLKNLSGSDIAVSVTGVAGPGSDDYNNPVGLVYIGICSENSCLSKKFMFSGSREEIRLSACFEAYNAVLEAIMSL